MKQNILITPEMIRAQSGEAAQLLTKLNKSDRNSKQARKIRRQLRKLGVSLSGGEKEKHIRRSLRTPLPTRKQVERKRRKLGLGVERTDQVLDTAQQLVLAGYKTPSQIGKRLLELYPKIDSIRADKAALQALVKKNHKRRQGKLLNPDYVALGAKEFKKLKRQDPGYKYGKYVTEGEFRRLSGRRMISNPSSRAKEIYGRILAIEAQKGPNSNYPNENFRHDFKKGSRIFGLKDGSILIKSDKGKKLWDEFKA